MYMRTTDGAQEFKLVKDFYGRTSFLFCNIHSVREDIVPCHLMVLEYFKVVITLSLQFVCLVIITIIIRFL